MRTNWLRKVALKLAAVGLLSPAAAMAAPLGVNLVANPGFESVSGTAATDWTGHVETWTYSLNYTGAALPDTGNNYWYGGQGLFVTANAPTIDLSENAADIDDGRATFLLVGFFSGWRHQLDFGVVKATFLDSAAANIGQASVGSEAFVQSLPQGPNAIYPDARDWGFDFLEGSVPAGTRSVVIAVEGYKDAEGDYVDGYIDNVDFQIFATPIPEPSSLALLAMGGAALGAWRFRRRRQSNAAE